MPRLFVQPIVDRSSATEPIVVGKSSSCEINTFGKFVAVKTTNRSAGKNFQTHPRAHAHIRVYGNGVHDANSSGYDTPGTCTIRPSVRSRGDHDFISSRGPVDVSATPVLLVRVPTRTITCPRCLLRIRVPGGRARAIFFYYLIFFVFVLLAHVATRNATVSVSYDMHRPENEYAVSFIIVITHGNRSYNVSIR